ncbi:PEP-CTERM sorting domain-containing protein [Silvimonas soli]|uniref:PEP-CTERM sorting domain-containing protein n=1 Tax=Silvimonas soli TaxID=2980100 RepID=UPI0024B34F7C|nr:PEP-CTERM sorting domain-containing protein [Silvimonas soli]
MTLLPSAALALVLVGLSTPCTATVLDFDQVPITPAMISSPSHTDYDTTDLLIDGYNLESDEYTDLAFGSFNGTPVAPAWSGTTALYIDPNYQMDEISPLSNAIAGNGSAPFALANVRVYAPDAPGGTILNINAFDTAGDNVGLTSFWYANVVVPAVRPGRSPWVFLSLPYPEDGANIYVFASTTPVFLDHLQVEPVPEPGVWALLGIGMAAFAWRQRRRPDPGRPQLAMP